MPRPSRSRLLEELAQRDFDVLVIGGGIVGCATARDAALRGLSVGLIERHDFASGTSSRSSRLVHGGLRYLEHGGIRLVLEASTERRRLLELAPHLVHPLPFIWPVYEGARVGKWKLAAGLTLYDALALFRNVQAHHRLSAEDVETALPLLRRDGLKGGARYFDAATDDARITLANALGAIDAGAVVTNHVEATSLALQPDARWLTVARDLLGGSTFEIRARVVVNATGPWSDHTRRLAHPEAQIGVHGSKGAHVAIAHERLPVSEAVTLLAPQDERVMFVLPAGPCTIVGTTERYTTESPDDVRATDEDIRYLLDAANSFFPEASLTKADVVAAWAGIRPLVAAGAEEATSATREHHVAVDPDRLVTITGGKLTTYRVMAEDVVDALFPLLDTPLRPTTTDKLPLPGGDFESVDALERAAVAATESKELGDRLVQAHGTAWPDVWLLIQATPLGAHRLVHGLPYTIGEAKYSMTQEYAPTLGDILLRRTRCAFETRDHGVGAARQIATTLGLTLGWTTQRTADELAAYRREIESVFGVLSSDRKARLDAGKHEGRV